MNAIIMVVDDDVQILRLIELVLSRLQTTIVTLDDPFRAMELLTSVTPDVIIVDQMMPRMSGLGLCRKIRSCSATKDTPIIMLSALYNPTSVKLGIEAGANIYLPKSALHSELVEQVRALLDLENAWC